MPTSQEYRAKAAECLAQAHNETDPKTVFEFQNLARSYLRLADYAERKQTPADLESVPPQGPKSNDDVSSGAAA